MPPKLTALRPAWERRVPRGGRSWNDVSRSRTRDDAACSASRSLVSECDDRVDARRAACRNETRQRCDDNDRRARRRKDRWIRQAYTVQDTVVLSRHHVERVAEQAG